MNNQPSVAPKDQVQAKPGAAAPSKPAASGAAPGNGQPQEPEVEKVEPIDPSIWRKYSAHHEFPISTMASFVLHFFAVLLIALFGAFILNWGDDVTPELDNIEFAGGGGSGDGGGDPTGNVDPKESIEFAPDNAMDSIEAPVSVSAADLATPAEAATPRLLEEVKKTDVKIRGAGTGKIAGDVGRGGTGSGGGKGSGHGTGEGDGSGPGKQSIRERRKDRWVLSFSYNSGEEYLRNLNSLQAIVVIPEADGKFKIFDDLTKRPLTGRVGTRDDVKKLNRIYWRDTTPEATHALAAALGLSTPPAYFWAFFPVDLEKELLSKELAYRGLSEEDIIRRALETIFTVESKGGKFVVKVQEQRRRTK